MTYDRTIMISVGRSRKDTEWKPQTLRLSELYDRLRTPARGTETQAQYLALKRWQQDELKDVGGFVAGALSGPRRKGNAVAGRDVLTIDLDNIPPGGTDAVLRAVLGLTCGACVYSTRKHSPAEPRLRVLLPLDRTVSADEYEPICRKAAEFIGLQHADPTTFEASRLMYFPSCSADGEYIYHTADKPFLSADGVLALYADWRDVTSWPQVPGAPAVHKQLAVKAGDPETKPGVIGAFCRLYDVHRAISELLPGVYEPCETDTQRYTFVGGSTVGGAVVYDGGKFLYSHHATDPCSGKLVNSFDLVRLHRFPDADDEVKDGTPGNRLPSYVETCKLVGSLPDVGAQMLQERYADTAKEYDGIADQDAGKWMELLDVDYRRQPLKTVRNLKVFALHDPRFKGTICYNAFSGRIELTRSVPWPRATTSTVWADEDTTQLRIIMEPFFGKISKNDLVDAVAAAASEQAFHPVKDYLNSLAWDGVPRLDRMLVDYLGAADTLYVHTVTRKAFVAAVARVMAPGIKYDTMLVLVGKQGRHKSSILAKMGGEWFSDSLRTFGDKDAMETIQGTWINEIAEMNALNRTDVNAVKGFLSKQQDYYRAAYGRFVTERPRQCVFFGTTNSKECLLDPSGGRRFWPVDIDRRERTKSTFEDLDGERDQLWAEAVAFWKQGEALYLPTEIEIEAMEVQEDHRERHPWEGAIEEFVAHKIPADWMKWDVSQRLIYWGGGMKTSAEVVERTRINAMEIWCEMLGKPKGDLTQRTTREINRLLERLDGWEELGVRLVGATYGKQRCYEKTGNRIEGNTEKRATD